MKQQPTVAVIGAGVIGLAVARELARRGAAVMVLEQEPKSGTGVSSRNSEVIHAGIYYEPGSLKARLCYSGKHLLYAYLARHDLAHARCGKLIVATSPDEVEQLSTLKQRAEANGVTDLEWLSTSQVAELEPNVYALAALHSPSSGILSVHPLMNALEAELRENGGIIAFKTEVIGAEQSGATWRVHVRDASNAVDSIDVDVVVNAAGLHADAVANQVIDLAALPTLKLKWIKGNYFNLRRLKFSRLVYPMPRPDFTLGTHVTIDLTGNARLGPDVEEVDHNSATYHVDPARQASFFAAARTFLPGLEFDDLAPGYSGIRPRRAGTPGFRDFYIAEESGNGAAQWINLIGIESPGLTACLAVGEHVADMVDQL